MHNVYYQFRRPVLVVSNAFQIIDNKVSHLVIYCLNCIRRDENTMSSKLAYARNDTIQYILRRTHFNFQIHFHESNSVVFLIIGDIGHHYIYGHHSRRIFLSMKFLKSNFTILLCSSSRT